MPEMPNELREKMKKQGYHFVGRHSAVKICEYTANGLEGKELCYKFKFYGIRSWQCIQSTPAIGCDLGCKFCWRIIPEEHGYKWNELNAVEWDDPGSIIDGMIKEQRRIVSGYKAVADTEIKKRRWNEANKPMHVALSLTGEPMFYPRMSDLIKEFHKRGVSTFLVHNGTLPEAIKKLDELPTQFYISLQAPDEETYMKTTRPKIPNAWPRFKESLALMRNMRTRTVLRMTLVKGLNMTNPEGYAELIKLAMPNYVEVKGFSFVGGSREEQRGLTISSMPNHEEIKEFAKVLEKLTGYIWTDEHKTSRIVLLSRDSESVASRKIDFEKIGAGK
ncbi:MAG: 4-demethylwyosine synthase TYW1 [Candidatus Marsarchaeota archaeon]|jgi:tRNA wybutosine-synthesizing protein 1|nr:4-demethylwyosine synthase TYW1 [Candidatus Marsarchaeota archaeon]MCL5419114.1 4-demethylwyosine synthase TYW1 [Candidatus Marsarchaeota archaeon]